MQAYLDRACLGKQRHNLAKIFKLGYLSTILLFARDKNGVNLARKNIDASGECQVNQEKPNLVYLRIQNQFAPMIQAFDPLSHDPKLIFQRSPVLVLKMIS